MEHKIYLASAVCLIIVGLYYYVVYQPDAASKQQISTVEQNAAVNKPPTKQVDSPKQSEKVKTVMVDVKGEVKLPGVYPAKDSERVNDVIKRAGGLTAKADQSQVNLAAHVQDEMMIFIPAKGEAARNPQAGAASPAATNSQAGTPGVNSNSAINGKININQADENELQNLPGIGPSKATAITQYRTENGPFQTVEDLKKVNGIGDKTFEKLKDSISVN